MNDRRSRVLMNLLSLAAMGNGVGIGLGHPVRIERDDFGPRPSRRSQLSFEPSLVVIDPRRPERSPAESARRNKRKAQRRARRQSRR